MTAALRVSREFRSVLRGERKTQSADPVVDIMEVELLNSS